MTALQTQVLKKFTDEPVPSLYDIQCEKFAVFEKKLSIIKDINIQDKLGRDDDGNLYIDKYQWGQYIRRVYYKQSRSRTQKFLDKEFIPFVMFLDKYLNLLEPNPPFVLTVLDISFRKFTNKICLFINEIIQGLYNLKKTYPDYKEIKCRIDSIIMTLVDFKTKSKLYSNGIGIPFGTMKERTLSL